MRKEKYPYYLAGKPVFPAQFLEVTDKYHQKLLNRVGLADAAAIEKAIAAGVQAVEPMRRLPAHARRQILEACSVKIRARQTELVEVLCGEAGKPLSDSRAEVARLLDTFRTAAEEISRATGEVLRLDTSARGEGYQAFWKPVPVGLCSFIVPFNFPLNLAAHKIAPAIAVGCPFILKPASSTPVSALILGEILSETALPEGAFSILPCPREAADLFTTDDRIKLLSFTGSPAAGWEMKRRAGKKRVLLELGGNAASIIEPDADLDLAVSRNVVGTFSNSGQSCISVQRILVHRSIYGSFRDRMISATQKLKAGDPGEEGVSVGPLITESDAVRLENWIEEAVRGGARLLCGGKRKGAVLEPTLLEGVTEEQKLYKEEAFGPIAILCPYDDFQTALEMTNRSRFGLQAGVFTRDIGKALRAWDSLEVGGVMINEVPTWRVDSMPYGGVKDSGLGREGVRYAMEEMSEKRLLVIKQ